jgi:hypothetical protein
VDRCIGEIGRAEGRGRDEVMYNLEACELGNM